MILILRNIKKKNKTFVDCEFSYKFAAHSIEKKLIKMKKITFALAACVVFAFAACGNNNTETTPSDSTNVDSSAIEQPMPADTTNQQDSMTKGADSTVKN
jgi:transcription initiation factor TFIIIB Brf1 subunit/transcription initiation factor TFIIB